MGELDRTDEKQTVCQDTEGIRTATAPKIFQYNRLRRFVQRFQAPSEGVTKRHT